MVNLKVLKPKSKCWFITQDEFGLCYVSEAKVLTFLNEANSDPLVGNRYILETKRLGSFISNQNDIYEEQIEALKGAIERNRVIWNRLNSELREINKKVTTLEDSFKISDDWLDLIIRWASTRVFKPFKKK